MMQDKEMQGFGISRRGFLKGTAALGGLSIAGLGSSIWFKQATATAAPAVNEKKVRSVCSPNCWQTCSHLVTVRDGKVVKTEMGSFPQGDEDYNRVCLRGLSHVQRIYHPDRITRPLKRVGERGSGKWEPISWDEALNTIAQKFKDTQAQYGKESVALYGGSGNYGILNGGFGAILRFAGVLQGTVYGGSIDEAMLHGFSTVVGGPAFGATSNEPADWKNCKVVILWGSSMSESQVQSTRFINDAIENGCKLIVVDPRFSTMASKADLWLSLKPGSDPALALSMQQVIISEKLYDQDFLIKRTVAPFLVREDNKKFLKSAAGKYMVWDTVSGTAKAFDTPGVIPALEASQAIDGVNCNTAFILLKKLTEEYAPDKAAKICELPAEDIRKAARMFATIKPGGIRGSMGIDRYYNGDVIGQSIATLLALTGNFGKSGNIQNLFFGPFEMTNLAWLFPAGTFYANKRLINIYDDVAQGKTKVLYAMCSNFINQLTDRNRWIQKVLPKLDLVVVADLYYTPSVKYADIVLPVAHWYETEEIVMGGEMPFFLYRDKAVEPQGEAKPDWEIWKGLAERLGFGQYFQGSPEEQSRAFIDDPVFKNAGVTMDKLKKDGMARAFPRPFIPYQNGFKTESGRVEFYSEKALTYGQELPYHKWPIEAGPDSPEAKKYPLVFNTQHNRFRIHSTYCNVPWLLELNPEPRAHVNPKDAKARGVKDGDVIEIFNDRGHVLVKCLFSEAIRPGMINLEQGWWDEYYIKGHHQELTHAKSKPQTTNFSFFDIRADFKKAEGV